MSKQINKIQVIGPIAIGVMIAVSMGASLYTAVQTSGIKTKLNALQAQVVEVENNGKSLYGSVEGHFAQLAKSGGGIAGTDGDVKSAVQAALAGLEEDKLAEKRAELYKGWEQVSVNKDGRYIYGNPDARFTLVNYEDLECPFCKQFHKTPKYLVDTANNGAVNWEWRHFNLAFHEPMATKAAMTAECVAEQKGPKGFWGRPTTGLSTRRAMAKASKTSPVFRHCLNSTKQHLIPACRIRTSSSVSSGIWMPVPKTVSTGRQRPS